MPRLLLHFAILAAALGVCLSSSGVLPAQLGGSVTSEHVNIRLPMERQSLGRDVIADLERCYIFMNGATDGSLPRKIVVVIDWNQSGNSCSRHDASVSIGMNQPAAAAGLRTFLVHNTAREIARLALLELSQGAERDDTEFLFEGMIEILAREYEQSSRSLEAAWVISGFLDRMQMLGLSTQRAWSAFSGGKRCLRSAAPGITFLTTLRELQGRDRPLKLFQAMKRGSLNECLATVFKAPAAELENIWLKKVREYRNDDDIIIASYDAPQIVRTAFVPDAGLPGNALQMRLFIKDASGNLLPDGVFVADERTGQVLQAQTASEKDAGYFSVIIPLKADCPAGQYNYFLTAADEAGNVRHWKGSYRVTAP